MSVSYGSALAVILFVIVATCGASASKPTLQFRADGSFRIVQFTDAHDGPDVDPKTVSAMDRILDSAKPDFVVVTGDCVQTDRCKTQDDLKRAIDNIARPMEARGLPWAITLGNHDLDNLAGIGVSLDMMLGLYMKYPHNLNKRSPGGVFGVGNANVLISGSTSGKPVFGIWLIDSNGHAGMGANERKIEGWDWVHFTQVRWYWDASVALEKRCGRKIPSLMFFHIPLREHKELMDAGKFTGEKNEECCCSLVNSGLFAAALDRGDVKGMFVGHDHVNTLVGDWHGIKLGYSGSIGYDAYGLNSQDDAEKNRLRGARVFTLRESDPASFNTEYVTADSLK